MEALSFDNILSEQEIETLFTDPKDDDVQEEHNEVKEENEDISSNSDKDKKDNTTEDVDPDTMFEEETPESVSSGENKEGKEGTDTDKDTDGTSPNDNFYSSIANALAVDGIFPNTTVHENLLTISWNSYKYKLIGDKIDSLLLK